MHTREFLPTSRIVIGIAGAIMVSLPIATASRPT